MTARLPFAGLVLAAWLMAVHPAAAALPDVQTLAVSGFVSASNLPLWVGQRLGFFREGGIDVVLRSPSGSVPQMRGLVSGDTPVLLTAFDNVVAYRRGQGAAEIGAVPDLVAVAGVDNGLLTLVVAPGITTVAGLRDRPLAVDAADTGFSFALKGMLAQAGLDPAGNPLVAVGNTAGRLRALTDGRAVGAVLTSPADLVAAGSGLTALQTVDGALGPYLGNVVATRRGWADAHRALLDGFLRAYLRSLDWATAPEHRDAAIGILQAEMPDLSPGLAKQVYARLADPKAGLFRGMAMEEAGLRAVLDLRARFGPASGASMDPRTYADPGFLRDLAR